MVNGKTGMGTKKKVATNNKMQYLSAYYIFFHVLFDEEKLVLTYFPFTNFGKVL